MAQHTGILQRITTALLLLAAASQIQTVTAYSTSAYSSPYSRSYSPHSRRYSPHRSYPASPPSEPPIAPPPEETSTAVSPTDSAGETAPSGPPEDVAADAPSGPPEESSQEITPDVLYGPPMAPANGAGCNHCDSSFYQYCASNLQVACDADKNYLCPACLNWNVTRRCDGTADPNCEPSTGHEFGLNIKDGEFSVDAVRGPVTEFLVLPGSAALPIPVRGTEDWQTIGEGIWSYAWDVAVNGHAPATPFKEYEAGLAIDPPLHRTQHQMHIHVAKLRPDVRKALVTSAWGKTSFTTFIDIPNPVSVGHVMRAVFIESSPKAPLGSTAYPFSRILDPTSKTSLAKVDGHTSGGEWPQYGMLIARSGPKDRSGYFIVGTYSYPGILLLCSNAVAC